jgi:hypothetical protein
MKRANPGPRNLQALQRPKIRGRLHDWCKLAVAARQAIWAFKQE